MRADKYGRPTKYASLEECRKRVRRAQAVEARASDPDGFAEQARAAMLRDRQRRERGLDKWPRLPAMPLAVFIEGRRMLTVESDEALCARYGTTARTFFRWRTGSAVTTPFEVADRVLQLAGVRWWDVFVQCQEPDAKDHDPMCVWCEAHRVAKRLFEPDEDFRVPVDCSDLDFFPGARGAA